MPLIRVYPHTGNWKFAPTGEVYQTHAVAGFSKKQCLVALGGYLKRLCEASSPKSTLYWRSKFKVHPCSNHLIGYARYLVSPEPVKQSHDVNLIPDENLPTARQDILMMDIVYE